MAIDYSCIDLINYNFYIMDKIQKRKYSTNNLIKIKRRNMLEQDNSAFKRKVQ